MTEKQTPHQRPELIKDKKEVSRIARTFMKKWDSGVLSTLYDMESQHYPMGSMTPYVLTEEGDVVILISDLAHHTKNIWKAPRVSFTVFDLESKHKQASPRVNLVGEATQIDEEKEPEKFKLVSEKYFTFFPVARNYFKAHNFYFFTIRPKHVHFVRTFGQIYDYLAEDFWSTPLPEWKGNEQSAIDHMNEDHKDTLVKFSKNVLGEEKQDVTLVSVDAEGFHMKIEDSFHYMNFQSDASDMEGLHREFVALARSC